MGLGRRGLAGVAAALLWQVAWGPEALARPLETADAGTVDSGALQLELGTAWSLAGGDYVAGIPAGLAFGAAERLELSLATEALARRASNPPGVRVGPGETALALKLLLHEGTRGPSAAVETSVALAPGDRPSAGIVGVLSQPIGDLALHLNGAASWSSGPGFALSAGGEGPSGWSLRPVVELGAEVVPGEPVTTFGTAGAVLDAADAVAFDAAVHVAADSVEARLGLTAVLGAP